MKKILIASAVAALFAVPALAGGPSGAVGAGANVNAGVNVGGRGANATANENSNGRFAADRDFGRDRAEERMSEEGRKHNRAGTAPNKKQSQRKPESPQAGAEVTGSAGAEAGARTQ